MPKTIIRAGPPICLEISFSGPCIQGISLSNRIEQELFSYTFLNCSKENELLVEKMTSWLENYANKKAPPPLNLIPYYANRTLSPFTAKVLEALEKIPFAAILSYKDIGTMIGQPRAVRAVGNACRINPFPLFLPCHRVIYSNGEVGNFAYGGSEMKRRLLQFESQ